ncbi:MAG: DUF4215 domain-containing protein [Myxococcota bacterium]
MAALSILRLFWVSAVLWILPSCFSRTEQLSQCGNMALDTSFNEQCDDGNLNAGDGCSNTCQVEPGWRCENEPSTCTMETSSICGNGQIELGETCDDNNTLGNDGCTDACKVMPYWVCAQEPSQCSRLCTPDSITHMAAGVRIVEVPQNCTQVTLAVWGAGGGSSVDVGPQGTSLGGGGAFVLGEMEVEGSTPTRLNVVVGAGGQVGGNDSACSGGGGGGGGAAV